MAVVVLVLWVVTVVYLVTSGEGEFFKGQVFNAPQTCEEIVTQLGNNNTTHATALMDAALEKDCVLSESLINQVELKLIKEQTSGL